MSVTKSLVWRLALPVPLLLALCLVGAWIFIPTWVENNAREDAIRSATQIVNQFKALRAYYTKYVVKKVLADGSLDVTFDHASNPRAIPLPATVIHELSALLDNEDTSISLFSPYPFPNRSDRVLDDFQTEAWDYLNANPDQVFSKTGVREGRQIVRVAIADKMVAQTCVSCHNTHPDSPKVGWRIGDVRGILEIAASVEPALLAGKKLSQTILLAIVIAGGILIFATVVVARGISKPLVDLTGAMNRISSGDELTEIPVHGHSASEIGEISRALRVFKQNLATIKQNKVDLQLAQTNLEDRVEKRTRELAEANESLRSEVDQRKHIAKKLVLSEQTANAANQAKTEFLASMSHEIRTPMNGVIGMTGVLLDSELSSEQREQVQTIKDSGDALLLLLNDILDLSKIEAGQVELEVLDFDLRGLLDSVVALWEPRLRDKGLTFFIDVAPDVAPVLKTDPTRLRQILFNLIGNAAKFTEQGGVTLDISQRHLPGDELELRFAVTDTGIGIALDARSRLFTKFSQADGSMTRKYGGTGLGLVICQQLTGLLGGEIGYESAPGEGSTFWFTIRCVSGNAEDVDKETWIPEIGGIEASVSDRPLRILVAEDNHVNQAVLLAILRKSGHKIDAVANGSEAVGAVLRVPYDLVLMDIQMPEMDGITATHKIRGLPGEVSNIPIIALTANAMKGDREKYIEAGMTDYVPKPINPPKLFAAIARCTGQEQTGDPYETENARHSAPDAADASDAATELHDLIGDLDALIKEA